MVCLGFVILLKDIVSQSSSGLHGSEQRASLLARSSIPPAPNGEAHRVSSELRWFSTPAWSPHHSLSYAAASLGAKETQQSMKSPGQPPTSPSPGDSRSMLVALPSSLIPGRQLQEEHWGRVTPGTPPVFLLLLLPFSCFWVSFRLLMH